MTNNQKHRGNSEGRLRPLTVFERIANLRYELAMQCIRDLTTRMACIQDADIVDAALAQAYFLTQSVTEESIDRWQRQWRERVSEHMTAAVEGLVLRQL